MLPGLSSSRLFGAEPSGGGGGGPPTSTYRGHVVAYYGSDTSKSVAAFTPTAGNLLVAIGEVYHEAGGNIGTALTITDTHGLTWTKRDSAWYDGGWHGFGVAVWTAVVDASTSITVSYNVGGTNQIWGGSLKIVEVAGWASIGLVAAYAAGSTTADPYNLSLGGTSGSSSLVIGGGSCFDFAAVTIEEGSGWTSLGEETNVNCRAVAQERAGAFSQVPFASVGTGFIFACAGIEILP